MSVYLLHLKQFLVKLDNINRIFDRCSIRREYFPDSRASVILKFSFKWKHLTTISYLWI